MRAAHQLLDRPRIFDDPLALRIIGVQAEAAVRANLGRSPIATFRPFVAVRSRYAEDELARAVQRGVRQYVVLGAGLDTFAYRNPYPVSRLRVFEVDHPTTQVWKRARLQEAGIAIPESLTFAAIDFETQTISDGLRRAGLKTDGPVFVSMLGVIVYLTRDAAMSTLKFVGSLPSKTEIVFDYAVSPAALSESDRRVHDDTTRVGCRAWRAVAEPLRSGGPRRGPASDRVHTRRGSRARRDPGALLQGPDGWSSRQRHCSAGESRTLAPYSGVIWPGQAP